MNPQDLQELLGGYATGTLTEAEQQALFAAALDDQELFDSLAREQSLRDLLRDPAAKAQLLASLDGRPARRWAWWPGAVAAAMAGLAAVAILAVRNPARRPQPVEMAVLQPPPAPAPVGPLGVVPVPAAAPRKPFVAPKMARTPASPLPEPPQVGMPKRVEVTSLNGVIGGVPPGPPPPKAETQAQATLSTAVNMFRDGSPQPAMAPLPARPSAQTLFYGRARMAAGTGTSVGGVTGVAGYFDAKEVAPANAGVRYDILRKDTAGNFVEVKAAELKTGDTVALRITPNTSGFLSVGSAPPVAVSAMTPHTTPPLTPGQTEVRIVFARQPQQPTATVQPVSDTEDHSTYVANPMPGQAVSFVIKLQYK
jgi:hypothetical protein